MRKSRLQHFGLVAALGLASLAASTAQATVYSSKTAYDAVNATTNDVTFGGIAPAGGYVDEPIPYDIGDLSIVAGVNAVSSASFFGTPTDTYFNNQFSDGTPATGALFTFASPVTSAGFSLAAGFSNGNYTANVFDGAALVSSSTFDADDQYTFDSFFGVAGLGQITSVDLYLNEVQNASNFVLVSEVESGAGSISAAPEPSTWALMIAGFGMIGATLRFGRRRAAIAVA